MPNSTILVCVENDKITLTNGLYGMLSGAPQILDEFEKEFKLDPTCDKFKSIVNNHYKDEDITYSEINFGDKFLDSLSFDCVVIFNASNKIYEVKSSNLSIDGDMVIPYKIYHS